MLSRDFAYWLQGYFEVSPDGPMSAEQVEIVKRHLALVFIHEIDPSFPKEQKVALDAAHAPSRPTHGPSPSGLIRC